MTTAAFHHLDEARQVETRSGLNDDVYVSRQDRELDYHRAFSHRHLAEESIEKDSCWRVDHGSAIDGTPSEVEEQSMSSQETRRSGCRPTRPG